MISNPALKGQKKVLTPEEKYKHELATEALLLRFQRQYHILEQDRKIQRGGGGQKQRKVINILKKEYLEILTDLGVAGSETNLKNDQKIARQLEALIEEHSQYKCEIKREKAYLDELEMQLTMVKKRIIQLRSQSLTEVQCTEKIREDQRVLEALENKLDTATKRFCTTIAENRELREMINHLLIERANFNKTWDRLCNNLSHGKKFMLDLIEQATIAYDQREEWCQKLTALRTKAYNEYLYHTSEMTNMQRQIDYGSHLQDFLTIKGQKRIMENLMRKEAERRELQRKELQALLESYMTIVESIREFMGESNIEVVAERFCLCEANNFSKFRYVNVLNKEMETLSDELLALHLRIDTARNMNDYYLKRQTQNLEALEEKHENTKAEADQAEASLKQNEATLNSLLAEISDLFSLCKCSDAPLLELLGQNSSINKHNALLYLKLLEKKVNEMIVTVFYKDMKKFRKSDSIQPEKMSRAIITITDLVSKDPCPLCVEQAMVSDVIDTLQKVMEKDQVSEKLEEAIEKRGFNEVVHNVSGCHLPKSRAIIQRRFQ